MPPHLAIKHINQEPVLIFPPLPEVTECIKLPLHAENVCASAFESIAGPVNEGDFILECIIQLEGGVKKRSAVKTPVVGNWPGGCKIRTGKEIKKGRRKAEMLQWVGRQGERGSGDERAMNTQQRRLHKYVQSQEAKKCGPTYTHTHMQP